MCVYTLTSMIALVLTSTLYVLDASSLQGTLLKPQMAMAGLSCPVKHTRDELVHLTLAALRRRVPPAVPGIVFLSGGQSETEATDNLNAIARAAGVGIAGPEAEQLRRKHPWNMSFSFGRSLQASVLQVHCHKLVFLYRILPLLVSM